MQHRPPPRLAMTRAGDYAIFLDCVRDRYFCLPPAENAGVVALLDGDPVEPERVRAIEEAIGWPAVTAELRALEPPALPAAVATAPGRGSAPLRQRLTALWHVLAATAVLRTRGLRAVLAGIRRDRPMRSADGRARSEMVSAHAWVSRHLTAHDACLVRSLALARHARSLGLDARLVMAVKADPFAAHCWVQLSDMLLNEDPDVAAVFRPILVVP